MEKTLQLPKISGGGVSKHLTRSDKKYFAIMDGEEYHVCKNKSRYQTLAAGVG